MSFLTLCKKSQCLNLLKTFFKQDIANFLICGLLIILMEGTKTPK